MLDDDARLSERAAVRLSSSLLRRAKAAAVEGNMSFSSWARLVMEVAVNSPGFNDVIPPPERHFLYLKCPRCGRKIYNTRYSTSVAYTIHYQNHIIGILTGKER